MRRVAHWGRMFVCAECSVQGDIEAAKRQMERVLQLDPKNKAAKRKQAELQQRGTCAEALD